MIDVQPGVPPAIALLLNEEFSLLDRTTARRKLRGMVKEIREQTVADQYSEAFDLPGPPRNVSEFRVCLDAGLDLFAHAGACIDLQCRLSYADQVARSVVLMADDVWMTDFISERFLKLRRSTNEALDWLLDDVYLLQRLRPLVTAGIVRFRSPLRPLCDDCAREFDTRVETVAEQVRKQFNRELSVERRSNGAIVIHTGSMYDPPIVLRALDPKKEGSDNEILTSIVRRAVRSSLWTAGDAARAGGSVFSNSKAGLAGLRASEGEAFGVRSLSALAGHRAASIPWVAGLTVEQTIQLRSEAAKALPRLREFLARNLAARPLDDDRHAPSPETYVAELREQAAEVRAELQTVTSGRRSLTRNSLGVLSLGIFAYGFATGALEPTAGLFQLLTTLGLLHQLSNPEAQHAESLRSKPGYVLVAAQDILAHASKTVAST